MWGSGEGWGNNEVEFFIIIKYNNAMNYIVSITSQGQLTIPKTIRDDFDINQASKAVVRKMGNKIVVEPKSDFWSLGGSLKSGIKLSNKELRKARLSFAKKWAKK